MGTRADNSGWAVSAAHPGGAEAGARALRSGGNAIDAACAAAWALGVCEPAESGLGGQTTMLIRLADGRCLVLDGHSRAPASLSRERVKREDQDQGMCATAVPSTPRTLAEAQRRFGRLGLAEALAPAIELAREGYAVTRLQRRLLGWTIPHWGQGSPEASLFLRPNGRAYRVGEIFRQPRLAGTLERLRDRGVEDFYEGAIAAEIEADMRERGGLISREDLRALSVPVERAPIGIDYRGHRVVSIPPPGGGVQVLLTLKIMEAMERLGVARPGEVARVLAARCAFEERERWPDHPADCDRSLLEWMVSDGRAAMLAERIARGTRVSVTDSLGESGNTTHLCAADAEGNIVTLTQSVQSVFGAKRAHPTLGFVYNNYLSTCPRGAHPYRLRAGGIPQSNAAPTLVLGPGGAARLALGSAGSRRITTSIVRAISGVLDHGESLAAAIDAPRTHALLDGQVWTEAGLGAPARTEFENRSMRLRWFAPHHYKFGAVQGLEWDESGRVRGAADPRRDGASRNSPNRASDAALGSLS